MTKIKYATVSRYSSEEYKDGVLRKKGLNTIENKRGSSIIFKGNIKKM